MRCSLLRWCTMLLAVAAFASAVAALALAEDLTPPDTLRYQDGYATDSSEVWITDVPRFTIVAMRDSSLILGRDFWPMAVSVLGSRLTQVLEEYMPYGDLPEALILASSTRWIRYVRNGTLVCEEGPTYLPDVDIAALVAKYFADKAPPASP